MVSKHAATHERRDRGRSLGLAIIAVGLSLAIGTLVWLAYRATAQWQQSTARLVEARSDEVLALLALALNRDMKGAQISVLGRITHGGLVLDPPHDLADLFAGAFARFPYPESFFAWKPAASGEGTVYFFNRADRRPAWDGVPEPAASYPVVIARNPVPARHLVEQAAAQAIHGKPYAVFDAELAGRRYQVVAHLLYDGGRPGELFGLVGFTVNLGWVRRAYLTDLVSQVARITGSRDSLSLAILDERGREVTATRPMAADGVVRERRLPLLFFDPALVSLLVPEPPQVQEWTARVSAADAGALAAGTRGARGTLILISLAALVTAVAMLLTLRAVRLRAALAAAQSEFVSTVTHELKTPLATIRLVGETLGLGRYSSTETVQEYARLLAHEASELTRLVDNLLAYARASDAGRAYGVEALDPLELVEEALDRSRPRLVELGFDVEVAVPADLPAIRGDRQALLQVLDNVIDNAIRYADTRRTLRIVAERAGSALGLAIVDRGPGIPDGEIEKVLEKFYRGRGAKTSGSGLGLAIARRIVEDHGGGIEIRSVVNRGTTVRLTFPTGEAP